MAKKQFLVIGLGRFGISVAETLCENGCEVMAVDRSAQLVDDMQGRVTHAVQANVCDADALAELGVRNFDVAVVTIGTDLKASAVATMLLKDAGVKTVVAKAHDEMHGRLLTRLGADRVVYPERDMGRRVAHNLMMHGILNYIEVSPDMSMVEVEPPKEWLDRTLSELNLRKRYGINVVAIRAGDEVDVSMNAETRIFEGDVLLVIGTRDALARLERTNG